MGLSPAFDINPNPDPAAQRATSVFGESGTRQARALRESAPYFGLSIDIARNIVSTVIHQVGAWRVVARRNGCSEAEIARFGAVFEQRNHELRDAFGL